MLYARLRLERVFDLRYRDLDNRWYPAERRGESLLIRARGWVVAGPAGDFVQSGKAAGAESVQNAHEESAST